MTKYSSRRGENHVSVRLPPSSLGSLTIEYRELQKLRERVKKAEAVAAKRERQPLRKGTRPPTEGLNDDGF
jgi:hypothetical protein